MPSLSRLCSCTIQYNTVQYSTIQYNTVQYSAIQYNAVQCSTIQYNIVQYSAIQYNRAQYSKILRHTQSCEHPLPSALITKIYYGFLITPVHAAWSAHNTLLHTNSATSQCAVSSLPYHVQIFVSQTAVRVPLEVYHFLCPSETVTIQTMYV